MPGLPVGRVGIDTVAEGLLLRPPVSSRVYVNGAPIAVVGTTVAPHINFKGVHNVATMGGGSATVYAGGLPVCANGHLATCGHPLLATSTVFVGG